MPIDLLHLAQRVPRLDDWFGCWLIELSDGRALHQLLQKMNWSVHFSDYAARAQSGGDESSTVLVPAKGEQKTAVIPITGTMMKSAGSTGGTSTVQVRRDIRAAMRDPKVSGIMLRIDSPGGTVAGTEELANDVRAARQRKTVFAQINDKGASAAYWIASQAAKVYANLNSAMVGSIGTVLAVPRGDPTQEFIFTSGPLKAPGADGADLDEPTRAHLQGLVDGLQANFDAAVKRGRKLSAAQLAAINTGAIFTAKKAQELGLIDGIQNEDATLAELAKLS